MIWVCCRAEIPDSRISWGLWGWPRPAPVESQTYCSRGNMYGPRGLFFFLELHRWLMWHWEPLPCPWVVCFLPAGLILAPEFRGKDTFWGLCYSCALLSFPPRLSLASSHGWTCLSPGLDPGSLEMVGLLCGAWPPLPWQVSVDNPIFLEHLTVLL